MKKITIRMATPADASSLLEIYKPYVEKTFITFEYEVPSEIEFKGRIEKTLEKYPYLVAIRENEIVGYAYASAFKTRAAYDWAVETSIYISESCHNMGIGTLLYDALEELLHKQGIINVNACIAYPNDQSISFHERRGYQKTAHFTKCGYKLGQWNDMIWMEKMLAEHPEYPAPVVPIGEIITKY